MANLTHKQVDRLNEKIVIVSKEIHDLLDKHGLSDLKLNEFHFGPREHGHECPICPETGRPGTLLCDISGHCRCVCP